jgi:Carboxypeptidase regulatory-like domain
MEGAMKRHSVLGSILFLCTSPFLNAQRVGLSGDIRGTITDSSGAVMQKVSVAVVQTDRGVRYTAATDSNGHYRMTALGLGTYEVSAAMPGFETQVHKSVAVNLGETVVVDFRLRVSPRAETFEVISEPPVVDPARGSQANIMEQQGIRDLPMDRHDYLTLGRLVPGAGNSNTIASNADSKVKQTSQSGLSFYGSNGRGNSITVDGPEANDDTGGVRLSLSQDAVEEFQVNRSNYSAELGSASGAFINIATRSGTNSLHTSLYGYFRNDALDARDPFAFSPALKPGEFSLTASGNPIKNDLNRQQFGGTLWLH